MHVEKYNRSAMGHMLAHYDRTHPGSKSSIDAARTHLNTNYAAEDQPMPQIEFIHKRLSQIKVHNRKDVNIFCDWIITAPKTLPETSYGQFFNETYKFMSERYGKENVISAYVHMDETQPHMHFAFIPVIIDKKKNIPKLCAKEIITKRELKTIHRDMSDHMKKVFGRDIGILNGATELGNIPVDVLRENTAKIHEMKNVIMTEKEAELEKKKNSIPGKIFGRETVSFNREEMDKLRDVMYVSEAVSRNADEIIADANKVKAQADEKYEKSCDMYYSTQKKCKEAEKEIAAKQEEIKAYARKVINYHSEVISKEEEIKQREYLADNKEKQYNEKLRHIAEREEESRRRIEEQEQEMLRRIDEPYAHYNELLREKDKIIALKNDFLEDHCKTEITMRQRNSELRETVSELESRLEEKDRKSAEETERAVSEARNSYENALSEKDEIIREKDRIISEKERFIGELKSAAERFKEKLDHAYQVIARICMAIAKLAFPISGRRDEFSADLTKKQEHLVDAVCTYAAKEAEKENFDNYAHEIRHSDGIAKDIREEYEELERCDQSYVKTTDDYTR